MNTSKQPLHKVEGQSFDLGKSIFPTFNVNVPMPSGTAVPPTVVVTSAPSAGTAPGVASTTRWPGK